MYLTYDQYMDMGGTLDDVAFEEFEFEARTIVDWYTFGRIPKWFTDPKDYPESLTRCMFALMKLLYELRQASALGDSSGYSDTSGVAGAIQSQSNDGVSISYNVVSASEKIASAEKDKLDIVQRYLNMVVDSLGRRILYRGLYPGE